MEIWQFLIHRKESFYFIAMLHWKEFVLSNLKIVLRIMSKKEGQSLLLPESIELDGVDTNFLKNSMIQLENFGFEIEEFGRNFFRIEACPTWLEPEEAKLFILDFIDLSRDSGADRKIEVHVKEALIKQLAKKREVNKSYSETEIVQLANELLRSRNPYTCPQGRPIYFELPIRDFENRFRRKL